MNDVILNWKKLKKFIKSEKTNNQINGKDRGYTHEEIQKILEFSAKNLNKKYYDKQGNVINDPDLIPNIQRGATVYRYHEEKQGGETITDKENV